MVQNSLEKNNKDVLSSFIRELNSVKHNQRSLVIITYGYVELLLNRIIDEKCKNGKKRINRDNRNFPVSVKLVMLHELDHIDNKMYKVLDGFRKIRNQAAHEAYFTIKGKDWKILNSGLDRFIPEESKTKPNDLLHFCKLLIGAIWNENLDIVSDICLK